jgi:hypothetical protein
MQQLNELTGSAPFREEDKLVGLQNQVTRGEEGLSSDHLNPHFSEDLKDINTSKFAHHGCLVGVLLE